jgi:hypothetical protein
VLRRTLDLSPICRCEFSPTSPSVNILTCDSIGTFYNALPGQNRKDLVQEWAVELYPDAWAETEKLGQFEHKEGHRLFHLPPWEMKA